MVGQVIRVIAGFYDVLSENKEYRVRASGNLRNLGNNPLVGDFVVFNMDGMLLEIKERSNELIRPKVANIDQAVVITSLKEPNYSSYLLNKMLAMVESQRIKPLIVFTKSDIGDVSPAKEYRDQGYEVVVVNNHSKSGIDDLRQKLVNKLNVFMGQTGAGKSSTINSLLGIERETQAISKALGRGKHTTRVVEVEILGDLKLIDTPGFSSFEIALSKLDLAHAWHDFDILSTKCKFRSCLHINEREEDCAVKKALAEEKISQARYNDYVKMMGEIK